MIRPPALLSLCVAAISCAASVGCQSRTATAPQPPPNPIAPALNDADPDTESHGSRSEPETPRPAKPKTAPVVAVENVLRGVDGGRLDAIADFLPESYQDDINAIVRLFAEKSPDELWTRLHAIGKKMAEVVQKTSQSADNGGDSGKSDYSAKLSAALDALTAPQAWDRREWKEFDLRSFLQGPASAAYLAWSDLSPNRSLAVGESDIELLELGDDHAVLKMQSPLDAEPREVEFVLKEGKWIPRALAESWDESVGKLRKQLNERDPEKMADAAARLRPTLLHVEQTLDQMIAADRPESVQLGWWQIQSLLMQGREAFTPAGPPPQVSIRLSEQPSEEDLTQLLDHLVEATDRPQDAEYLTFPTATGLLIQISPVEDFASFVKRLTFLIIKSEDADERTIDAEPIRSPS